MTLPIREDIERLQASKIVDVWRRGFGRKDLITLAVGEGDLPTPKFIADAAYKSMLAGETYYNHKRGLPELRDALARYYRRHWQVDLTDERISVTSSGMNALMLAMQIGIGAGDNMVAVSPVWPNIFAATEIMGGTVRLVALDNDRGQWKLDLDKLFAAVDRRTRVLYAASPGNPTGWVMSEDELRDVVEFCRLRNIWFAVDEVYNRLIYDRAVAPSALQFARVDDPVIVVNSFSKTWAMTGWRIGWMVSPPALAPFIEKLVEYNTSGGQAFLQRGALAAVEEGEQFVAEQVARYRAGRDLVTQRLGAMRKVRLMRTDASMYVMFQVEEEPDSYQLAIRLVDEVGVGLAPGVAFGEGGEGYLRLCFAVSQAKLSEVMNRLEPLLDRPR
jgi:aspartate/methionine/tyrosine aminotransferase